MAPPPLYTPLSLETTALANYSFLVKIVGDIIEKIKKVRSFRSECSKLANSCILMSLAFLENDVALEKVRSGKEFMKCLQEVFLLVTQCTEKWSILHVGWEVVIRKRVETLTRELDVCQKAFDTEVLINVNSSSSKAVTTLLAMKTDLVTLKTSIDDNTSERQQFMNHFQELDRVLEARRQEQRSLGPPELTKLNVIALPDERVIIEKRDRDSAPIDGNFDGQPVYFERVQITGDRLPRLVKIYRQIGDVTLVQKLLGIAEINEKQYIMMQNLKSYPSIEDAIQDQSLGAVPYLQKLRFAYELSATVSSLHQNGLLVKVLSDVTVFVEKTPEEDIRPLLSDLKSARDMWEVTPRHKYDVRYEAPESAKAGMRSRMSDIWSLGIVLWQCFTGSYPYMLRARDIRTDAQETNQNSDMILQKLREGIPPFDLDVNDGITAKLSVLKSCLSRDPAQRPTASSLAQQLFDILIAESSKDLMDLPVTLQSSSTYGNVSAFIERLLKSVQAAKAERRASKGREPGTTNPPEKFNQASIDQLIKRGTDTDPLAMFLVGTAYLWCLVELEEEEMVLTGKPPGVQYAERALPYLGAAHQQGYKDAAEELFHAHKLLATYYRDMTGRIDE